MKLCSVELKSRPYYNSIFSLKFTFANGFESPVLSSNWDICLAEDNIKLDSRIPIIRVMSYYKHSEGVKSIHFLTTGSEVVAKYDPLETGLRGKAYEVLDNEAIVGAYGIKDSKQHITSLGLVAI